MAKTQIQFSAQEIDFPFRGKTKIAEWLLSVAKKHKRKVAGLQYIFVDDKFLLEINREFLKHKTLTDIITFDYSSEQAKGTISGEIYISLERVAENAEKFKVTNSDELHRVMAHGLLHLCGFRDKSATDKKQMRRQEEIALTLRKFK